jgi:hypothetical protein
MISFVQAHIIQSYGVKGKAIILGVLMKKFPISISQFRNDFSITMMKFLEFVLTPHVAMCLIQQDLQLQTLDHAYDTMVQSSDFGDRSELDENDEEVEQILRSVSDCPWLDASA